METKKLKKILSLTAIVCVAISALIGIALLFEVISMKDNAWIGQILLTLLTVFVASVLLTNSIAAIERKNTIGTISVGLILFSALLFLLSIWVNSLAELTWYMDMAVIISMLSIMFNMIVGNYLLINKRILSLQIAVYVTLGYIELTIASLILGNDTLISLWQIFVADIIAFLTLYIILRIKSRDFKDLPTPSVSKTDTVTISKEEYESLLKQIEDLKAQLGK